MKTKTKKICLVILAVLIVTVSLVIANETLNEMYYYPQSTEDAVSPFKVSTQLLAPSVQYMFEHHSFGRSHLFGTSELTFYLSKVVNPYMDNNIRQNENKGKIVFAFGKATASFKDDMGLDQLTYTQEYFNGIASEISYTDIKQDKRYEVYLGFAEPLSLEEMIAEYTDLFYYRYNNHGIRDGGVAWIPIKTSDNPNDICIGAIAAYGVPLFQKDDFYGFFLGDSDDSSLMSENILNYFLTCLKYGVQNQEEAGIYLNSGLFPGAEYLQFEQRLEYIHKNPVECLGMVVHVDGDILHLYQNDSNMNILKIIDQEDILFEVQ